MNPQFPQTTTMLGTAVAVGLYGTECGWERCPKFCIISPTLVAFFLSAIVLKSLSTAGGGPAYSGNSTKSGRYDRRNWPQLGQGDLTFSPSAFPIAWSCSGVNGIFKLND